jgi:carbamoyltransferase
MGDIPTVVGINRTQDGSLSVVRAPSEVWSLQKERVTRRKHHWGRLGDLPRYAERLPQLSGPVDLVVECFSSDAEIRNLPDYERELDRVLSFRGERRVVRISHHLSHLYSAFPPSPFDTAAVMVIDAQGSHVRDFTEPWTGGSPDLLECASFYACAGGRVDCLDKQLWDGDWRRPAGLGCFYYLLTRMIFPGEGNEGKVMGLAPFGRPHALGLPPLAVEGAHVLIPDEWNRLFQTAGDRFAFARDDPAAFQDCADLAAAGQLAFEEAILQVADWLHAETGLRALCFAGGTALNCSANGRLMRESRFAEVFIPPSPHDGGTAVGCALYGMNALLEIDTGFRWANDFLGPDPSPAQVREVAEHPPEDIAVEQPADLLGRVVGLLEEGRVVGLHQGRSESGPRALGNRSILADARRPGMQPFINSRVKGREWFRPLAPLVLADVAGKLFDVDRPAPFMQFAADVRPEYRSLLPSVTHVDGTARLQTVEEVNTPVLHDLLRAYEAATGCPLLLNTSLNGPGQPLTETPHDSLECFRTTDMHALAMPPYLMIKRVQPDLPE